MLDFLYEDFKSTFLNVFRKLKETIDEKLEEMGAMQKSNELENINKERNCKKDHKDSGADKYNN